MSDARGDIGRDKIVHTLPGDDTVLCVVVQARSRVVIVVNEAYPEALTHAEQHLDTCVEGVLICAPDCDGSPTP